MTDIRDSGNVEAARERRRAAEREFFYALANDVELVIELAKAASKAAAKEERRAAVAEIRKERTRQRWEEWKAQRAAAGL